MPAFVVVAPLAGTARDARRMPPFVLRGGGRAPRHSAPRGLRSASGRRCRRAGARCCTSPNANDHKTEVRRVHYPWHPLHGQVVVVRGEKKGRKLVLRCRVDGDDRRDNRDVSTWMFDLAACSRMQISSQPHVSWETLIELRRFFDDVAGSPGEALEDLSPSQDEGIHEAEQDPSAAAQTERTLPQVARATNVVGGPRPGAQASDGVVGAPAERRRRGRSSDARGGT